MKSINKQKKIGALVIGQTPRPDLVEPLQKMISGVEIKTMGALDGLALTDLPDASHASYPLSTKMAGKSVVVAEDFLVPRLQLALNQLEAEDVVATILLCAGTFANLRGKLPLIKPFDTAVSLIHTLNLKRLGFIAPFPQQEAPIRQRWVAIGVQTTVWTANIHQQDNSFQSQLEQQIEENDLQAIVLDYVGHPITAVRKLQKNIPIPVIDLGMLASKTLAGLIGT